METAADQLAQTLEKEPVVLHRCGGCNATFESEEAYIAHTCKVTGVTPADPGHHQAIVEQYQQSLQGQVSQPEHNIQTDEPAAPTPNLDNAIKQANAEIADKVTG